MTTVSNDYPAYVDESKGAAVRSNSHNLAHELTDKGDPKVNGPYLDDVRALEEEEYRRNRKAVLNAKKNDELENVHRAEKPGGKRVRGKVPKGTKKHPRQRPLSNPSDGNHPEENLEVPTLDQVREDMHVVTSKPRKKAAAKKAAKKPAKKTSSSKAVKKVPAKKAAPKAASKKK